MRPLQRFFGGVALNPFGTQVDQNNVRVGAVCHSVETALDQLRAQGFGVGNHVVNVSFELWALSLAERHGFGGNYMHQWPALNAWKDCTVKLFRQSRVIGQDHPAARSPQCFVRRSGGNVSMGKRTWMGSSRNQARDMGHIDMQIRADTIGNFSHFGKINLSWHGGTTGNQQLRLVFICQGCDLFIVDQIVFAAHSVLHCVKPFAGLVGCGAVG